MTDLLAPSAENVRAAARAVRAGLLVAFPTETVYGLGANALDPRAVRRVFDAKGRPADNPLILHVPDADSADLVVAEVPDLAAQLMERFWPGPLTLVLPKDLSVPDDVTAGLGTVAVRAPDHPLAQQFLQEAQVPVAAPSANRSGRPSATTTGHVLTDLDGRIDLVLDGGACPGGLESTVVRLVEGDSVIEVLRAGGLPVEALEEVAPTRVHASASGAEVTGPSPGTAHAHYAPSCPAIFLDGPPGPVWAWVQARAEKWAATGVTGRVLTVAAPPAGAHAVRDAGALEGRLRLLGPTVDEAAASLFDELRALDADGVEEALLIAPPAEGLGRALRDRMLRAAGRRRIELS